MLTPASPAVRGFPAPGIVVSIPFLVFWRHKGVVSDRWDRGKPTVISGSGRASVVCEEPWDIFADGFPVRNDGFPGLLSPHEVVRRVRALLGTRYRTIEWNCDHVVAVAHGQRPESSQVAGTAAVALVALGILAARKL